MSYSDDAVKSKLSALNETHESIVTVAQWIMFHRRYADRTSTLWLQRLKDSGASKRVNLIYLANEIIQQSKNRHKSDFLNAFSPVIAEAVEIAYKDAHAEIQAKVRRTIEVWRAREVFEKETQEDMEKRIEELDKSQPAPTKRKLGGSLFSGNTSSSDSANVPSDLQPLLSPLNHIQKSTFQTSQSLQSITQDFETLLPSTPSLPASSLPTPPVLANRLSTLLKTISSAESSIQSSLTERQKLIASLEKLIQTHKESLSKDQERLADVNEKRTKVEDRKREVEDGIMRGLPAEEMSARSLGNANMDGSSGEEVEITRPDVERFTPEPDVDMGSDMGGDGCTTPPGLPLGYTEDFTNNVPLTTDHNTTIPSNQTSHSPPPSEPHDRISDPRKRPRVPTPQELLQQIPITSNTTYPPPNPNSLSDTHSTTSYSTIPPPPTTLNTPPQNGTSLTQTRKPSNDPRLNKKRKIDEDEGFVGFEGLGGAVGLDGVDERGFGVEDENENDVGDLDGGGGNGEDYSKGREGFGGFVGVDGDDDEIGGAGHEEERERERERGGGSGNYV